MGFCKTGSLNLAFATWTIYSNPSASSTKWLLGAGPWEGLDASVDFGFVNSSRELRVQGVLGEKCSPEGNAERVSLPQ